MALNYFEDLIGEFFQEKGFFIIQNIKYKGNKEIDLLGINPVNNKKIHVEITETRTADVDTMSALIEKKFINKDINKIYNKLFGSSNDINKIYVVWTYYTDELYKQKDVILKKYNVTIISHEEIFEYYKNRYPDKMGDTYPISHLLDLFMRYEEEIQKRNK